MTTLDEWDRDVRPYLDEITFHSEMAKISIRAIKLRPIWITNADAEMKSLERVLVDALNNVRKMRIEFGKKTIEFAGGEKIK